MSSKNLTNCIHKSLGQGGKARVYLSLKMLSFHQYNLMIKWLSVQKRKTFEILKILRIWVLRIRFKTLSSGISIFHANIKSLNKIFGKVKDFISELNDEFSKTPSTEIWSTDIKVEIYSSMPIPNYISVLNKSKWPQRRLDSCICSW